MYKLAKCSVHFERHVDFFLLAQNYGGGHPYWFGCIVIAAGMISEHWSPRNYTIYRNLEQLVKRSFGLIQEHLNRNVPMPTEEWEWTRLVLNKRGKIQKLPEFGECVKSMLADKEMLALNDKEIQAFGWSASRYVSKVCILPFLEKLVLQIKSREFDDVVFKNLYAAFENAIYASVFEYKAWSQLKNFDSRIDRLVLAPNLRIRVPGVSEVRRRRI